MGGEEGERARIKASKWTDTVRLDCGAFNNQQMLQVVMECRGGLTLEEEVMMTMMESTSVTSGGVGKGDGDCDSNGDGNSNSGGNASTLNKCCR